MKKSFAVRIVDRIMDRIERWVGGLTFTMVQTPDPPPENLWDLRRRAMEEYHRLFGWGEHD